MRFVFPSGVTGRPGAAPRTHAVWPRAAALTLALAGCAATGAEPGPPAEQSTHELTRGLRVEYFDNVNFTGPRVQTEDPDIDHRWADGSPIAGINGDTFSARWTGEVMPQYSQVYTFYADADDGVRVWVGGELIIDGWTNTAALRTGTTSVALTGGRRYPLVVEYFDNTLGAKLVLDWSSASQPRQLVPQARLYPPATSTATTTWGALGGRVDNRNAIAAAGLGTVEFEVRWDRLEPNKDQFAQAYIDARKADLARYAALGIKPTLTFAHHYRPPWVCTLPGAAYVNQNGAATWTQGQPCDEFNVVFSANVRNHITQAIDFIAAQLGPANFAGVRVHTAGLQGEISYPSGGTFWAYDANATNGTGPSTIPPRPDPTWKPGSTALSTAAVRLWLEWYLNALADAVDFQIAEYQRMGFAAPFHAVAPGRGVSPNGVNAAVNNYLGAGTSVYLGQGVAWYDLFGRFRNRPWMTVYASSVAQYGAAAQDCASTDGTALPNSTAVNTAWDVARYMHWVGLQWGMRAAGENPGAGSAYYGAEMMTAAVRVAKSCNFRQFLYAHEDNLVAGTGGGTLALYDSLIP